jgi:hypothetical protein
MLAYMWIYCRQRVIKQVHISIFVHSPVYTNIAEKLNQGYRLHSGQRKNEQWYCGASWLLVPLPYLNSRPAFHEQLRLTFQSLEGGDIFLSFIAVIITVIKLNRIY